MEGETMSDILNRAVLREVPGNLFDVGVAPVGPMPPREEKKEPEVFNPWFSKLSALPLRGEDNEQRADLLQHLWEAEESCKAFYTKQRARLREEALAAHEALKEKCREKKAEIDRLDAERWELVHERDKLVERKAAAAIALDEAQQARARLSRFATQKEIREAEQLVEDRTRILDTAIERVGALNLALHRLELNDLPKLRAEFEALVAEEMELDGKITGQAYQHLGLVVPARPPL
jgi:hypothetical protein